jgi:hypothetical protein
MALWAFIPAKHIEAVGGLPQSARRLDTGELVVDLHGYGFQWVRACGWWDLDAIDVPQLVATNHLTPDELAVLTTERTAALAGRTQRQNFIDNATQAWSLAKDALQDVVDQIDRPPMVGDAGFPTLNVALTEQQLQWVWTKMRQQDQIIIGIADVVIVMASYLSDLIDEAAGLTLPT